VHVTLQSRAGVAVIAAPLCNRCNQTGYTGKTGTSKMTTEERNWMKKLVPTAHKIGSRRDVTTGECVDVM